MKNEWTIVVKRITKELEIESKDFGKTKRYPSIDVSKLLNSKKYQGYFVETVKVYSALQQVVIWLEKQ